MKGIKFAIQWIADNDNPGDNEKIEDLTSYISVMLVADMFEKQPIEIARRVYRLRNKKFNRFVPFELK